MNHKRIRNPKRQIAYKIRNPKKQVVTHNKKPIQIDIDSKCCKALYG